MIQKLFSGFYNGKYLSDKTESDKLTFCFYCLLISICKCRCVCQLELRLYHLMVGVQVSKYLAHDDLNASIAVHKRSI